MKANKHLLVFIVLCLALFAQQVAAQVTIGSSEAPVAGAALQIKTISNAGDTVNSTLGVALPRVYLTKKNELFPMFEPSYSKATEGKRHTGLIVYNTGSEDGMKPGLYVWDGAQWMPASAAGNNNGGETGCIINEGTPDECIDTDCDGICDDDDISPNDPCNAIPEIQMTYTLNGTTLTVNPNSPTITVKQDDVLTLTVTEAANQTDKINKVVWSTGATSKSIKVNTSTINATGKEFTVHVNNCTEEYAQRKVTVITDVNNCKITHSGGALHQSFSTTQTNFNNVVLQLPNNGNFTVVQKSNTTIQGLLTYNFADGKLTFSLDPTKITSPMPTGGIVFEVKSADASCTSSVEVIATWGMSIPYPRVTLVKYIHKETYSPAQPYNVGDVVVGFDYSQNREFGVEGGLLVQEWNSTTIPPIPAPVYGGTGNLLSGNLSDFTPVTLPNNGEYTCTDVVSSFGDGKMYTLLAWTKGADGQYYYGNYIYATGVAYNREDLVDVKYVQTVTSKWGSTNAGDARTWLQYEIVINPNRKNDGYKRDANGYGKYTARNVMPDRLTADSANNPGIWIMTQDATYELPNFTYGVDYVVPSLSKPGEVVKWSADGARDQAALDRMEKVGLSYYLSGGGPTSMAAHPMKLDSTGICPKGWRHLTERELNQVLNTAANKNVSVHSAITPTRGADFNYAFANKSWYYTQSPRPYSDLLGLNFFLNGNPKQYDDGERSTTRINVSGAMWLPRIAKAEWSYVALAAENTYIYFGIDGMTGIATVGEINITGYLPNQTNVRCVLDPRSRNF